MGKSGFESFLLFINLIGKERLWSGAVQVAPAAPFSGKANPGQQQDRRAGPPAPPGIFKLRNNYPAMAHGTFWVFGDYPALTPAEIDIAFLM